MTVREPRCIVCGGPHQPMSPFYCDEDGMEREITRMGAPLWNRITAQVMRLRTLGERPGEDK
jgi:hypothetical protein